MISFVVPAHDEQRLIVRTLEAIHLAARSVGEPYEVIVVDDASSDDTALLAAEQSAMVLRVDARQIARARNHGAAAATGDWLVFVDADTLVDSAVVRGAAEAISGGAAGGGARARFDGRIPIWAKPLDWVWSGAQRLLGLSTGCFLFCSREAFEAAGRFDEGLFAMEDLALSRALRRQGSIVILRHAVVTSGRNLRGHSFRDALTMLWGFLRHGSALFRTRDALPYWYGHRHDDP